MTPSFVHNFSAGPCILPQKVFKQASEAVLNFNNLGLSILEISHRSEEFVKVIESARALVLELLELDSKAYSVLFLQGGASTQFLMTAQNLMTVGGKAGFLDTGTWASKAIKEAKLFGDAHILGSSSDKNYAYIPKGFDIPEDLDYVHYTSNNTIYGTQMHDFPAKDGVLKVCDMSSDIYSRNLDYSQFDLIYAGAQKNVGPAGATLVILKKDILGKTGRKIPSMLNYKLFVEKESMFNTPPVFSIYVSYLNLLWLKEQGGVKEIAKLNAKKADVLYQEIDRNPLFTGHAATEDRSQMNVTFRLMDERLTEAFDALYKANRISGVKGHRSVGGYRASLYNALQLKSVEALVSTMQELEKQVNENRIS